MVINYMIEENGPFDSSQSYINEDAFPQKSMIGGLENMFENGEVPSKSPAFDKLSNHESPQKQENFLQNVNEDDKEAKSLSFANAKTDQERLKEFEFKFR